MSAFSRSVGAATSSFWLPESSDMNEDDDCAKGRRLERNPIRLPGNDFAVLHEFAREVVGRVGGEPDNGRSAFGDGTDGVFSTHVGADPARTDAVHGEFRKRCGELDGDAVQCGLR